MERTIRIIAAMIAALMASWTLPAAANMASYTAEPVSISNSVPSNIMIILDNSGSMNQNAYGSSPGADDYVYDEPFAGEGRTNLYTFPVISSMDDMEENGLGLMLDGLLLGMNDLQMGVYKVGVRFQDVKIPPGATITSANITFIADESSSTATTLTIDAQASDNAPALFILPWNLSSRAGTAATVTWTPVAWTSGNSYSTVDISTIVQELVNRAGWQSGNAMLFRVTGSGKRVAESRESGTNYRAVLRIAYEDGNLGDKRYYGYFSPDYFYSYGSAAFRYAYKKVSFNRTTGNWSVLDLNGAATTLTAANIVSMKLWDGNWLNWLTMRRIDVLRKVLFGGDTHNTRDGSGKQMLYGESSTTNFKRLFDSTACAISPYKGSYPYEVKNDAIYVASTSYNIHVEKQIAREPSEFFKYDNGDNLAGVLQKIGDETVRWGNIWFRFGTGAGESGGYVENPIGTDIVTLVKAFEAKNPSTWTPLAETLYVAMQYFRQENPDSGLDYYNLAVPNNAKGDSDDPYYQSGAQVRCAKSFVLLLTDGASTRDAKIPSIYKDYDGDGADGTSCNESTGVDCDYDSGGTDYLDDVALYAHTVDLRGDIEEQQTFMLYTVYAFGNDENARILLSNAAKNGGFEDQNRNRRPDLTAEWDKDGNTVPDTYFEASDGYLLESQLMAAFGDMAQRIASATSASVLATNSEGEGTMVQSFFVARQANATNTKFARWLGYLQALWVDDQGVMRDDSGSVNYTLDKNDKEVTYLIDADGNTRVNVGGADMSMWELSPIFEAGKLLSERAPTDRAIFTFIDKDRDGVAEETTPDFKDQAGELIAFHTDGAAAIKPFLGVADNILYGTGGMNLGATHDTRVANIVNWVRGTDIAGLRSRTLDGVTHRLGDIMHSTPVTVGKPADQYHTLYSDRSYLDYWNAVKNRETMIYVGANDGMLHAFTNGKYTHDDQGRPTYGPVGGSKIGDEVWAFIPQAVLPHLKWVAHANYSHTYLVDGRPRVFDAKILPDETHYTDSDADPNWGTFLVMGLRMGARHITVTEDFGAGVETRDFDPTYLCLDITDPRNPRLMWERAYADLGMSWSRPAPVKVGERWYLTFGSGPTGYDAVSNQPGYLYVVDLKTGEMLRRFGPVENAASLGYFNDPASFDKSLNFNVDAIYTPGVFFNAGAWQGGIYKIAIPCDNCPWDSDYNAGNDYGYDPDPNNWIYSKLFASDRPISTAVSLSSEYDAASNIDNVWLYFGTGRYLVKGDIVDSEQQYLHGIKDPYFNSYNAMGYRNYTAQTISQATLMRTDTLTVTTAGHVLNGGTIAYNDLYDLEKVIQKNYDGWYYQLEDNGTGPSERIISVPAVLGGMVFSPVFTPDNDMCHYGGTTSALALYYATGTGYFKQIFTILTPATVEVNGQTEEVVAVRLPVSLVGAPPSSAGFHAGRERGAKALLQQSTGETDQIDVIPPFFFQGAIIDWWE